MHNKMHYNTNTWPNSSMNAENGGQNAPRTQRHKE